MLPSAPTGDHGYFDWMYRKWNIAWDRFDEHPHLSGLRFLDFGCGHGAYSIRAAEEGASVLGLDTSESVISAAQQIKDQRFESLDVTYTSAPLDSVEDTFDMALTNEVFEHVVDLAGCLRSLYDHLKPGGRLFAAWGPLWFSPTGGHQVTVQLGRIPIPWSHLARRRPSLKTTAAGAPGHQHAALNYLRPRDYLRVVAGSPFEVLSWRVNPGDHPVYRVLRTAARVAPTPFTANIYAILVRP